MSSSTSSASPSPGGPQGGPTVEVRHRTTRRVAFASFIGTAIEWYDFFIYALAAVLIIGPQFFPSSSELAATLAAFASFAIGFIARPLGGIILGHLGDRVGRKKILVFTLLTMGTATTLIGVIPTYATIGVGAPVVLVVLRLVQGIAAGGEWGGAVLLSVEHAPEKKRGFYGSFTQVGLSAGLMLANLVFLAMTLLTSPEQFTAWGWRIPFLLSAILVIIGLWVRWRLEESPEFATRAEAAATAGAPLISVIRTHWRQVLLSAALFTGITGMGYIAATYSVSYGTTRLGLSPTFMLIVVMIAAAVELPFILWSATMSDRLGRSPVIVAGAIASVVVAVFFLPVLSIGSAALVLIAVVLGRVVIAPLFGPSAAFTAESFPVEVRYSGSSLGFQLGSITGGALAPLIATALAATSLGIWAVSLYAAGLMVISGIGAFGLGRLAARRTESEPATEATA